MVQPSDPHTLAAMETSLSYALHTEREGELELSQLTSAAAAAGQLPDGRELRLLSASNTNGS